MTPAHMYVHCKHCSVITVVKTVHMSGLLKKAEVEAPTIVQVQEENGNNYATRVTEAYNS